MQPKRKETEPQSDQETCQIDDVLLAISGELLESAKRCTEIQWVISDLLERAHHPNLSAEMLVLQDIDRIQQTLQDIARVLHATAEPTEGLSCSQEKLIQNLKLDSLRSRIFHGGNDSDTDRPSTDESSDITWL